MFSNKEIKLTQVINKQLFSRLDILGLLKKKYFLVDTRLREF